VEAGRFASANTPLEGGVGYRRMRGVPCEEYPSALEVSPANLAFDPTLEAPRAAEGGPWRGQS